MREGRGPGDRRVARARHSRTLCGRGKHATAPEATAIQATGGPRRPRNLPPSDADLPVPSTTPRSLLLQPPYKPGPKDAWQAGRTPRDGREGRTRRTARDACRVGGVFANGERRRGTRRGHRTAGLAAHAVAHRSDLRPRSSAGAHAPREAESPKPAPSGGGGRTCCRP